MNKFNIFLDLGENSRTFLVILVIPLDPLLFRDRGPFASAHDLSFLRLYAPDAFLLVLFSYAPLDFPSATKDTAKAFFKGNAVGTQRECWPHPMGPDFCLISAKPFTPVNYQFDHPLHSYTHAFFPPPFLFSTTRPHDLILALLESHDPTHTNLIQPGLLGPVILAMKLFRPLLIPPFIKVRLF